MYSLTLLEPHSHMWGQDALIISSLSPKRDWGPKRVNTYLRVDPPSLAQDFGELLANIDRSHYRPAVHEIPSTPSRVLPLLVVPTDGRTDGRT